MIGSAFRRAKIEHLCSLDMGNYISGLSTPSKIGIALFIILVVIGSVIGGLYSKSSSSEEKEKLKVGGSIYGGIIGLLLLIGLIVFLSDYMGGAIKEAANTVTEKSATLQSPASFLKFFSNPSDAVGKLPWGIITPILLTLGFSLYLGQYIHFTMNTPLTDVDVLRSIRKSTIDTAIGSMTPNTASLTKELTKSPRTAPYIASSMPDNAIAMVNFRPLTVRLAGYLGGQNADNIHNGVFEMGTGIQQALNLGARAFVFDIDYLDAAPCDPAVVFRDIGAVKRSLNTGSIKDGMREIAARAFENNNLDPVIVILYLRRVPECKIQKSKFFEKIAIALDPLSQYHLGQTQDGNFHMCESESALFTTAITRFQKKIIVLTNYDTSKLDGQKNPKNSLHWWTNARIWQHPSGIGTSLGSITTAPPASPGAYAQIGDLTQFLGVGPDTGSTHPTSDFQTSTQSKFTIALAPPDVSISVNNLNKLMNVLGVQCVPLDVLALAQLPAHTDTLTWKGQVRNRSPTVLGDLSNVRPTSSADLLAFWTYGGWSRKSIQTGFQDYKSEGFEDVAAAAVAQPIPGYIIPAPKRPSKPSPTMNAAGGVVSIG